MSMRCRITKLDSKTKNKIIALLYVNGCAKEDVTMLVNEGTLADISGIIDLTEVFGWILMYYAVSRIMY